MSIHILGFAVERGKYSWEELGQKVCCKLLGLNKIQLFRLEATCPTPPFIVNNVSILHFDTNSWIHENLFTQISVLFPFLIFSRDQIARVTTLLGNNPRRKASLSPSQLLTKHILWVVTLTIAFEKQRDIVWDRSGEGFLGMTFAVHDKWLFSNQVNTR